MSASPGPPFIGVGLPRYLETVSMNMNVGTCSYICVHVGMHEVPTYFVHIIYIQADT